LASADFLEAAYFLGAHRFNFFNLNRVIIGSFLSLRAVGLVRILAAKDFVADFPGWNGGLSA
jgi:hypothetical protein